MSARPTGAVTLVAVVVVAVVVVVVVVRLAGHPRRSEI